MPRRKGGKAQKTEVAWDNLPVRRSCRLLMQESLKRVISPPPSEIESPKSVEIFSPCSNYPTPEFFPPVSHNDNQFLDTLPEDIIGEYNPGFLDSQEALQVCQNLSAAEDSTDDELEENAVYDGEARPLEALMWPPEVLYDAGGGWGGSLRRSCTKRSRSNFDRGESSIGERVAATPTVDLLFDSTSQATLKWMGWQST